jgi:hypothetical protein
MPEQNIHYGLLGTLVRRYEQDCAQFLILPKETLDSSFARLAIAELRNLGLVEEQVRGVIRLTALGYRKYKNAAAAFGTVGLIPTAEGIKYDGPIACGIVHVR